MFFLCSENKDADKTVQLICVLVFLYANIRFSHDINRDYWCVLKS